MPLVGEEEADEDNDLVVSAGGQVAGVGMTTHPSLVAYVRVSTQKQGVSGLGMEAQQASIAHYATVCGGKVVQTFTEVESGRRSDREQLRRALAYAKRVKGRLVIAKLDRLARNVAFVSTLMESGTDFVACDQPYASPLTIHILAAVSEDEAKRISQRTKEALAAARARGVKMGSARPDHWKGREGRRMAGALAGTARAKANRDRHHETVRPTAKAMREAGSSLQVIADRLNDDGVLSARGKAWTRMGVKRLLLGARS